MWHSPCTSMFTQNTPLCVGTHKGPKVPKSDHPESMDFEGSVLTTELGGIHDGLGNCNPNA